MNRFPKLQTGAVAQYPAGRRTVFSTWIGQFVGGGEQRCREYPSALRRWLIDLRMLTSREVSALREFFLSEQGRAGLFEFEDPWDSTVFENCSFESDACEIRWEGEQMGRTRLIIRQNRI
jgi:hypothetical protein